MAVLIGQEVHRAHRWLVSPVVLRDSRVAWFSDALLFTQPERAVVTAGAAPPIQHRRERPNRVLANAVVAGWARVQKRTFPWMPGARSGGFMICVTQGRIVQPHLGHNVHSTPGCSRFPGHYRHQWHK